MFGLLATLVLAAATISQGAWSLRHCALALDFQSCVAQDLPPGCTRSLTVALGDTCDSIAAKNNVST